MAEWKTFLKDVQEAGGSTDMQTSATGRYPWLFHFCRDQADRLGSVIIYAHCKAQDGTTSKVIHSPPRDWRTKELILSDYAALKEHGAFFNDTKEASSTDGK